MGLRGLSWAALYSSAAQRQADSVALWMEAWIYHFFLINLLDEIHCSCETGFIVRWLGFIICSRCTVAINQPPRKPFGAITAYTLSPHLRKASFSYTGPFVKLQGKKQQHM